MNTKFIRLLCFVCIVSFIITGCEDSSSGIADSVDGLESNMRTSDNQNLPEFSGSESYRPGQVSIEDDIASFHPEFINGAIGETCLITCPERATIKVINFFDGANNDPSEREVFFELVTKVCAQPNNVVGISTRTIHPYAGSPIFDVGIEFVVGDGNLLTTANDGAIPTIYARLEAYDCNFNNPVLCENNNCTSGGLLGQPRLGCMVELEINGQGGYFVNAWQDLDIGETGCTGDWPYDYQSFYINYDCMPCPPEISEINIELGTICCDEFGCYGSNGGINSSFIPEKTGILPLIPEYGGGTIKTNIGTFLGRGSLEETVLAFNSFTPLITWLEYRNAQGCIVRVTWDFHWIVAAPGNHCE